MTYREAIRYLESLVDYEKISVWPYQESLKLERINLFLDSLGNPQRNLRVIHVAGSKGKGSTCAFIAYMLRQAGFKVGLYTSPHLVSFRERIRILGRRSLVVGGRSNNEFEGMISREALKKLIIRLKPGIDKFNKISEYGPLSFFEVYTALAFVYFKEQKADFVILETGLGGRLDATNVVNPLVCVITPISYEHTQKLGSTLKAIAQEKAGIIKSGKCLTVITAPQEKEALKVFKKECARKKVRLVAIQKASPGVKVNLIGSHQRINAAVALAAIKALDKYGIKISSSAIKKGLANTKWPCRCDVIFKNPYLVLDGAQNVASARVLKSAIKRNFKYGKLILILGISEDKDIPGICRELNGFADKVILTKSKNPRAIAPSKLAKYFSGREVIIANNTQKAKKMALSLARGKDLILVTGSLFVTAEFKR